MPQLHSRFSIVDLSVVGLLAFYLLMDPSKARQEPSFRLLGQSSMVGKTDDGVVVGNTLLGCSSTISNHKRPLLEPWSSPILDQLSNMGVSFRQHCQATKGAKQSSRIQMGT